MSPGSARSARPAIKVELTFVPTPSETVVTRDLDGLLLLIDESDGTVLLLDALGSALWRRFDGKNNLETIIDALTEEFPAEDELEYDAWDLTEEFANEGLLAGISEPPATPRSSDQVASAGGEGVPVGSELGPFRLADVDGAERDLADLRGRQVLLVNWSPGCGYCRNIASQLAELEAALDAQGTEMVFVAGGAADANRALRDEYGLSSPILLRDGGNDPFRGAGTPVAYLLDAEGRVAAPRATGNVQVPALARQAAGLEEQSDGRSAAHRVPVVFARMDEPRAQIVEPKEGWQPTVAYEVGHVVVGLRADTPAAESLVARLLADYRRADADAELPANYSLALGGNPTRPSRALRRLFQADTTVVRSRSTGRVLSALAAYLSEHLPGAPAELFRTYNVALIVGGEALLLPAEVADRLEELEPRLSALGARLVDEQYASIAPDTAELVVLPPSLTLDSSVLEELEEGSAEGPRVEPGRYPLRAWFMWESEFENEEPSRADAVYAAFETVGVNEPTSVTATVDSLDRMLGKVAVETLPDGGPARIARCVERYLTAS